MTSDAGNTTHVETVERPAKLYVVAVAAVRTAEDGRLILGVDLYIEKATSSREARALNIEQMKEMRFPESAGWKRITTETALVKKGDTHVGAFAALHEGDPNLPVLAIGISQYRGEFSQEAADSAYADTYETGRNTFPPAGDWKQHKAEVIWLEGEDPTFERKDAEQA